MIYINQFSSRDLSINRESKINTLNVNWARESIEHKEFGIRRTKGKIIHCSWDKGQLADPALAVP